ncbi:hypothetical protein ACFL6G_01940 [candidate division KSB1 bacterium]
MDIINTAGPLEIIIAVVALIILIKIFLKVTKWLIKIVLIIICLAIVAKVFFNFSFWIF